MSNEIKKRKHDLSGRLFVQLFKIPWVKKRWSEKYQAVESDQIPWTELSKPLAECKVSFVTTGGIHKRVDPPYNMQDHDGDPSFRSFPADSEQDALQITHNYYDHKDADKDINILLPFKALKKLVQEGKIGSLSQNFYSFMGHIQGKHLTTLQQTTAFEVTAKLKEEGVDVVILSPA